MTVLALSSGSLSPCIYNVLTLYCLLFEINFNLALAQNSKNYRTRGVWERGYNNTNVHVIQYVYIDVQCMCTLMYNVCVYVLMYVHRQIIYYCIDL